MPKHPAPRLVVTEAERASLRALLRVDTTGQRLAMRARIILAASTGMANQRIAAQLGIGRMTVLLWRGRFERDRLAGLEDAPRPGREPIYDRAARDQVIALTFDPPPKGTTHWSSRALAARTRISTTTIQRILAEAGLEPHRADTFQFSTVPGLATKVRDVVALYLAPPERAFVLSFGETHVRAPHGRAATLPLEAGPVDLHARDSRRDGTTQLFAALHATRTGASRIRARHVTADFLAFLRRVERAYPEGELQVVLDNVIFYKTAAVRVNAHTSAGFHFHLTPTSAWWMNQIDAWFRVLSRQAIRRGSLRSAQDLTAMIAALSGQWNEGSTPFTWVKTADWSPTNTDGKPRPIGESER